MTLDPSGPADREAARLLRDMAAQPRQTIIWAMYHGAWSSDTADALERGTAALSGGGDIRLARKLAWVRETVGFIVGYVLESGTWPPDVSLAMTKAAEALEASAATG